MENGNLIPTLNDYSLKKKKAVLKEEQEELAWGWKKHENIKSWRSTQF